ncbi:MAG TPA: hypothetical protein V6D35_09545 [Candidatus Sericytochromatia bacterium]
MHNSLTLLLLQDPSTSRPRDNACCIFKPYPLLKKFVGLTQRERVYRAAVITGLGWNELL